MESCPSGLMELGKESQVQQDSIIGVTGGAWGSRDIGRGFVHLCLRTLNLNSLQPQ